jgi:hypothetical protein
MNGKKFFVAEFFRRYELQPFEVDLDTLDDDSDFIAHLMTRLEVKRWKESDPLYYAVPGDSKLPKTEKEKIRGFILDGRHRSWAWQLLWEKERYPPEPRLEAISVNSLDHALIYRAVFELDARSKNSGVAKKHVEKILMGQIDKHYGEFHGDVQKAVDFFKKNSFTDDKMIAKLFKKAVDKKTDPTGKNTGPKPRGPGINDTYFNKFGGKVGTGKQSITENALPAHDDGTSLDIVCPECKTNLICSSCMKQCYLFRGDNGTLRIRHIVEAVH